MLIFTRMNLENLKTENDARLAIVEKILKINDLANGIYLEREDNTLEKQEKSYKEMINYVNKKFPKLDVAPYNTILNKIIHEVQK